MKQGWKIKKLGEIAEYFIGLTYSPKDVNDKGIVVLRSSNIQNDKLDFSNIVRVNRPIKDSLIVQNGDILMCSRNGSKRLVGKTATIQRLEEDMTFGTFMTIVRSQYNSYLSWFFKSNEFRRQINGGENPMINQITKYMLNEVSIPLPPISDQKRIVKILDETFSAINKANANAEKNLQNSRELFDSYLNGVFANPGKDWEENEFRELIELLTDYHANGSYQVLKANVELKESEDYAWMVRSTDFENNFKNNKRYITNKAYNFLKKSKIFGDEIIISKIGNAGKVYLMPKIDRPCSLAMNLFLIKLNKKKCLSKYIYRYLNSKNGRKQIESRVLGTTTKTITKDNVRSIKIPFPSLKMQQYIVAKLDTLSDETKKLETLYQYKTADLDDLKKSILQKAFEGQL